MKVDTLEHMMRRGMEGQNAMKLVGIFAALGVSSYVVHLIQAGVWWKIGMAAMAIVGLCLYAYDQWQEGAATAAAYAERLAELQEETYHAISFADSQTAAAFVESVCGHLEPQPDLLSYHEDVEIAAMSNTSGATTLYLSEGAARAFSPEFPAPLMQRLLGKALPWNRVGVLVGAPEASLNREEIVRRIEGKHVRLPHRSFRLTATHRLK